MKNTRILLLVGLLLLLVLIAGCAPTQNLSDVEWRCSAVDCAESVTINGQQWAQQNCAITENGTLCRVVLNDGQAQIVPLDQLNLSAITATQCLSFVCVEETPFRAANYSINTTAQQK